MSERWFVFTKPAVTGLVGRRDLGEQVLLVAGGVAGLGCLWMLPVVALKVLGLVGFLGSAVAVVFMPYRPRGATSRRSAYRWFEINRHYRRTLRHGGRWRSGAREAGVRLDGSPMPVGPPPGIGPLEWATCTVRGNEVGVLLHPARGLMSVVFEVESTGMAGLDVEEQVAVLDRWGLLLDHYGNDAGHLERLQVIARQVRADGRAHEAYLAAHVHDQAPAWMRASYEELAGTVSTTAEQHRYYVVAGIRYSRDFAAEAALHGEGEAGTSALVGSIAADLWERLAEAELRVLGALGVGRLAALIRNVYTPERAIDDPHLTRVHAWPHEVDATEPRYLRARSAEGEWWYHATAAVTAWPQTPVGINFLTPLLVGIPDVIRTTSVTLRLEPNEKAVARAIAEATNQGAEAGRAARRGRTEDPREARRYARTLARGDELAAGHAGVGLVGYLTVTAPSVAELERACKAVRSHASRARLRVEWCDREHARALACTLPMTGGIRS